MHILIVDDEPDLVESLIDTFADLGHTAEGCYHAEAARSRISDRTSEKPDMVLTDIRMPGASGLDLLRWVTSEYPGIPVAIISGHADMHAAIEALRHGAIDLLIKPFDSGDLRGVLRRAQSLRKQSGPSTAMVASHEGRMELRSDPDQVPEVSAWISQLLPAAAGRSSRQAVVLGLNEALTNAIVHGNLEVASALKEEPDGWERYESAIRSARQHPLRGTRTVELRFHLNSDKIRLEVEDRGHGFTPPSEHAERDPLDMLMSSGRGITLIRHVMDEVEWNERGNSIIMTKRWQAPGA